MLEKYFSAPKTLRRLRTGLVDSTSMVSPILSKARVTQRRVLFVTCAMRRIWANLQSPARR